MSLEELIGLCISAKQGNTEFCLMGSGEGPWFAVIGNKSRHVAIGESMGYTDSVDFEAEGPTPVAAVEALYQMLTP